MLAVSAPIPTNDGRDQSEMEVTSDHFDFPEFGGPGATCLLDSIDFDDFFVGIHDGDVLPDLEMDSDLLAEFSVCPSSAGDQEEDSAFPLSPESAVQAVPNCYNGNGNLNNPNSCITDEESKNDAEDSVIDIAKDDEIESKKSTSSKPPARDREKTKKPSPSQSKNNNNNNKRKTKVDWTADLHRRFVQAVEQLGVDKAVPSRILELMGNDCLTRHNVASHLQKYRSHRKHLLAREAEAASWTQKRQMYGIAVAPAAGGSGKSKVNHHQPYIAPTISFPPPMTPPPPVHHHPYHRPLHVWGHPTHHVEHQPMMPIWPKQLVPPPATWAAAPPGHHPRPPVDPSYWHAHHQHRFAAPPVPGIPTPHTAVYKHEPGVAVPQSGPSHTPLDYHPTKESIDAVIGDVLSKPWLPLPIGLKPPSTDSVMGELQRQGIPSVPPSTSSSS